MPRAPRADEAGGLHHALNRGNLRADIFLKEAEFAAFERILHEGLEIHQIERVSNNCATHLDKGIAEDCCSQVEMSTIF